MKLFATYLVFTAALVVTAVAQAGNPTSAQLRALEIRGQAMNQLCSNTTLSPAGYRAVCGTAHVVGRPTSAQLNALEIQGQAMNQLCSDSTLRPDGYKALCGSTGSAGRLTASQLNALETRGQAMNQLCAGKFASVESFNALCGSGSTASQAVRVVPANGFDWNDFGIGVAAAFGAVLLAGGIAAGVHYGRSRHNVRPRPRPVS
jgi:hypothetical protein